MSDPGSAETVVVDASALVDLLIDTDLATPVRTRLTGAVWRVPAHLDAEVLSALGRLSRAGRLTDFEVDQRLALLGTMPLCRHHLPGLLDGAWTRRSQLRLTDALYVELAAQLQAPLITTDQRLAKATPLAEVITI